MDGSESSNNRRHRRSDDGRKPQSGRGTSGGGAAGERQGLRGLFFNILRSRYTAVLVVRLLLRCSNSWCCFLLWLTSVCFCIFQKAMYTCLGMYRSQLLPVCQRKNACSPACTDTLLVSCSWSTGLILVLVAVVVAATAAMAVGLTAPSALRVS